MSTHYHLRLLPAGVDITAPAGSPLRDLLFDQGVEFPCGGNGRCRGCKIHLIDGELPITPIMRDRLTEMELAEGWRMACQCRLNQNLSIELRQWSIPVLTDNTAFPFISQEGLGIAADIGTTTVAAQLVDLSSGQVIGVRTGLNPQACHGADLMSRIQYAIEDGSQSELESLIHTLVYAMVTDLLQGVPCSNKPLRRIVLVGNTAMHNLFCGIDVTPLAYSPFEPKDGSRQVRDYTSISFLSTDHANSSSPSYLRGESQDEMAFSNLPSLVRRGSAGSSELPSKVQFDFLPCLGGFVGSDILAGILATGIAECDELSCLLDLGTNGEIVIGNSTGLYCASTAAGPAFEGARISMGMRASNGAIWKVQPDKANTGFRCETIGKIHPLGICGSGLVDAVAALLDYGLIKKNGRFTDGSKQLLIADPVYLTQADIREVQLAKAAIASGVHILLKRWGASLHDVKRVYLAGAFGNYINRSSAYRIGLLPWEPDIIEPVGNTALLGAKIALCHPDICYDHITSKITHFTISVDPEFQDIFVDQLLFPQCTKLVQ